MEDPSEIPVVILAGGRGARFDSESQLLPKPMIRVAGKPILEHIVDGFMAQGFRRFIVASGYLGDAIVNHFALHGEYNWISEGPDGAVFGRSDVPMGLVVFNTGEDAHTGLRLWRVRKHIGSHRFVLTYGDGLSDVDMLAVLTQHEHSGAGVTLTAVHPPGRFGIVEFTDGLECTLEEHAQVGWINGGFMVMEPEFITQYIEGEFELESTALRELGACGGLHAYKHSGYWRCMDTRRDREQIEEDVRRAGRLPWMR